MSVLAWTLIAAPLVAWAVCEAWDRWQSAGRVIDNALAELDADDEPTPIFDALVTERAEFVASVLADIDALGGDQ